MNRFLESMIRFNSLLVESDEERRRLERKLSADPSDTLTKERLFQLKQRSRKPKTRETLRKILNIIRRSDFQKYHIWFQDV